MSKTSDALKTTLAGFTAGQKAMTVLALIAVLLGRVCSPRGPPSPRWCRCSPTWSPRRGGDHRGAHHRGTQYELAEGGTTVLVPQQDVYQLRLDLSAAGLPEAGEAGYELLDEQGITTSEFRQRVDYQRALEGELAKTISVDRRRRRPRPCTSSSRRRACSPRTAASRPPRS
jgi:flagellar M-ring protein FliF